MCLVVGSLFERRLNDLTPSFSEKESGWMLNEGVSKCYSPSSLFVKIITRVEKVRVSKEEHFSPVLLYYGPIRGGRTSNPSRNITTIQNLLSHPHT